MSTEAEISELSSLVSEVREQVAYFKELGVEGLEHTLADLPIKRVAKLGPERSAATTFPEPMPFSTSKSAARAEPKAQPAQATTPNADSLFGDLSVEPVKIERSAETFEQIWADIGDCTRCPLHQGRTNIVNTDGQRPAAHNGFWEKTRGAGREGGPSRR